MKYTIQDIQNEFAKDGYVLITKIFINTRQPLEYRCKQCKRIVTTILHNWRKGHRCIYCAKRGKLTYTYIKDFIERYNYKLISFQDDIHSKTMLEIQCDYNHQYQTTWNNFQKGQRCRKCYFNRSKGPNHPRWNPNLTPKERLKNRSHIIANYIPFVKKMKKKFHYTCVCCKLKFKSSSLRLHHLNNWAHFPDKRTDENNITILCKECHDKEYPNSFHHIYGNNVTENDFISYQNSILNSYA